MIDALQWLWPQWLWGLPLAAALPVAVHLFSRRSGVPAMFPAVRFVQAAMAQQRHGWRTLRHWLLMLLRIVVLSLLCLAMAQPTWWPDPAAAANQADHLYTVLLLDASASMSRPHRGVSLFEQAKADVLDAIDSLDASTDRAMVVAVTASPFATMPRFSGNLQALRQQVQSLGQTWEKGDLSAALQVARQAAAQLASDPHLPAGRLEIHLFGDMQATGFGPSHAQDEEWSKTTGGLPVVFHPVGQARGNVSIAQMSLSNTSPVVGQPTRVSATLSNHSRAPVTARVRFRAADESQVASVGVGAQGQAQVTFNWQPARAGVAYLGLHLEDVHSEGGRHDALAVDDRTGRFVHVGTLRQVLFASLEPGADQDVNRGAYYLGKALEATAAQGSRDVQLHRVTAGVAAERWTQSLDAYAAVVVAGATSLSDEARQDLLRYIGLGGGVFWVVQNAAEAATLFDWRAQGQPVSPLIPKDETGPGWRRMADGSSIGLAEGAFEDPVLAVFEGSLRAAVLAPRFASIMQADGAADARVLIRFDDGAAALAVRPWGRGRLAVLGADIAPAQSDLVKQPVFVALVHQVIRHLSPGRVDHENPQPGQAWASDHVVIQADAAYALESPGGSRLPIHSVASPGWPLTLPGGVLSQPGAYRLYGSQGDLLDGVHVDLAPEESDLATFDTTAAETNVQDHDGTRASSAMLRREPIKLWPFLLVAMAMLVVMEGWLAGAGSPSRFKREGGDG